MCDRRQARGVPVGRVLLLVGPHPAPLTGHRRRDPDGRAGPAVVSYRLTPRAVTAGEPPGQAVRLSPVLPFPPVLARLGRRIGPGARVLRRRVAPAERGMACGLIPPRPGAVRSPVPEVAETPRESPRGGVPLPRGPEAVLFLQSWGKAPETSALFLGQPRRSTVLVVLRSRPTLIPVVIRLLPPPGPPPAVLLLLLGLPVLFPSGRPRTPVLLSPGRVGPSLLLSPEPSVLLKTRRTEPTVLFSSCRGSSFLLLHYQRLTAWADIWFLILMIYNSRSVNMPLSLPGPATEVTQISLS